MPGFDISCDGIVTFNGSRDFWACAVNDYGVQNIYTKPVPDQLKCLYITVTALVGPGKGFNYTGCKKSPPEPNWNWPWDKLYNNSEPASPLTPHGESQMASYLKGGQHAGSNATVDKPKDKHGVQSKDGRCGASTGLHCFGKTDGPCCSRYGWCGLSALHCGFGCQSKFGICDGSSSAKPPNSTLVSSKTAGKPSSTERPPSCTPATSEVPEKISSASKTTSSASASHKPSSSSKASPSPTHASSTLSPDGRCGGSSGYHCNGFGAGSCCGASGWCGSSPVHCGSGCQTLFGVCKNSSSSATVPSKSKVSVTSSRSL